MAQWMAWLDADYDEESRSPMQYYAALDKEGETILRVKCSGLDCEIMEAMEVIASALERDGNR